MTKSQMKLPVVFSLAVLSFAFLVSFGFLTDAWAIWKCDSVCLDGFDACRDWCAKNRTGDAKVRCNLQCQHYWLSGKNPQSIGRPPPPPPPPPCEGIHCTLRNPHPPTTVGPPTRKPRPVKPVKPVDVSNPNKTTNAPVILLRKNDSGGGQVKGH
jgi:hypothetical protein